MLASFAALFSVAVWAAVGAAGSAEFLFLQAVVCWDSMAVPGQPSSLGQWVTALHPTVASSSILRELGTGLGTLQSC